MTKFEATSIDGSEHKHGTGDRLRLTEIAFDCEPSRHQLGCVGDHRLHIKIAKQPHAK